MYTFHLDGREYRIAAPSEHRGAIRGDRYLLVPTERQLAKDRVKEFLANLPERGLSRGLKDGVVHSYHTAAGDFELFQADLELLIGEGQ